MYNEADHFFRVIASKRHWKSSQDQEAGIRISIFFYTSNRSDAAKHYLKLLQELSVLNEMTILSMGTLFLSSVSLGLRTEDLLLLFTGSAEELDELLALRDELNNFRVILILPDSALLQKAYSLQLRYVALQDEEMMKIEAVIKKINTFNIW